MKNPKDGIFWLGFICLLVYVCDLANIVIRLHHPSSLLWYSNFGLLATAIALLRRDSRLIFTLFCALFVIEAVWVLGFLSLLILKIPIRGIAEYAFINGSLRYENIFTLYHVLIPFSLLAGILKFRRTYTWGWAGAFIYSFILFSLTYFFAGPGENVNCIHDLGYCRSFIPLLTDVKSPLYHILIFLPLLTLLVFIPTNRIMNILANRMKWGDSLPVKEDEL